MTLQEYKIAVDKLCERPLYCTWDELCGDDTMLEKWFADNKTPMEFVTMWAEKYELEWRD